jgi:hypothetical protein
MGAKLRGADPPLKCNAAIPVPADGVAAAVTWGDFGTSPWQLTAKVY